MTGDVAAGGGPLHAPVPSSSARTAAPRTAVPASLLAMTSRFAGTVTLRYSPARRAFTRSFAPGRPSRLPPRRTEMVRSPAMAGQERSLEVKVGVLILVSCVILGAFVL